MDLRELARAEPDGDAARGACSRRTRRRTRRCSARIDALRARGDVVVVELPGHERRARGELRLRPRRLVRSANGKWQSSLRRLN